jgi:hypothetical protein
MLGGSKSKLYSYCGKRRMERHHPSALQFEPANYRICILGTLEKGWSDYFGGMTIEHARERFKVTLETPGEAA